MARRLRLPLIALAFFAFAGCETTTTTMPQGPVISTGEKKAEPRGFFGRLSDEFTERECNVVRFTCPFGLGPADEPCYCTDPRGVVLQGRTIK